MMFGVIGCSEDIIHNAFGVFGMFSVFGVFSAVGV